MEFRKSTLEGVVIYPQFWKEKTVLLTGHTGFKGSWLSIWLKKMGVNLIGVSKSVPTKPSLFEEADVENSQVIEIASNDGYLLQYFKKKEF